MSHIIKNCGGRIVIIPSQQGKRGTPGIPGATTFEGLTDSPYDNDLLADALNGKADIESLDGYVPTSRTVNGKTLSTDIEIDADDVGLGNVDDTSDANKPVSTAQQAALDGKASSASLKSVDNGALTFSDVFASRPDGDIQGAVSNTGQAWDVYSPDAVKFITQDGAATLDKWFSRDVTSPRNYPAIDMVTKPRRMGAWVSFHKGNGGVQPAVMVLLTSKSKTDFNGALHCAIRSDGATLEFVDPDLPGLNFITLDSMSFGGRDTKTVTCSGTVSSSGNLSVKITSNRLPNGDFTLPVAVTAGDTAAVWAGKVNTALGVFATNKLIHQEFQSTLAGTTLTFQPWVAKLPDPTFNLSISNGTAAGITPVENATVVSTATPRPTFGERIFVEMEHVGDTLTLRFWDPKNPFVLSGTNEKLNRAGGRYAIWEWFGHGAVTGETPRMNTVGKLHAAWAGTDAPPPIKDTLAQVYRRAYPGGVDPEKLSESQPFAQRILAAQTREEVLAILGLEKVVDGGKPTNIIESPNKLIVGNSLNTWSSDGLFFSTNSGVNPIPTSRLYSGAGDLRLQSVDQASGGINGTGYDIRINNNAPGGAILTRGFFTTEPRVPVAGPGLTYNPVTTDGSVSYTLRYSAIPGVIPALTDAATVAIDAAASTDFTLQLTSAVGGTRVLGNPTNPTAGQKIWLRAKQPASGGPCNITFGSAWNTQGRAITLSTAANAEDWIQAVYNGPAAKWDVLMVVPASGFAEGQDLRPTASPTWAGGTFNGPITSTSGNSSLQSTNVSVLTIQSSARLKQTGGVFNFRNVADNADAQITFGGGTSSGPVTITDATASSSSTTGSLILGGGLGVGQSVFASGNIVAGGNVQGSGNQFVGLQGRSRWYAPNANLWRASSNGTLVDIDVEARNATLSGSLTVPKTITPAGTTGAQTINQMSGSVNFAAAAGSLVVTNSLVSTSSIIQATVASDDTTMKSVSVVAAAGSFTLRGNAGPASECRVSFLITN